MNLFPSLRSSDGRIVVVSSLDGYCSIISFEEGELGKPSSINPMEYVSSKLKAKREAKKEAKQVQSESKNICTLEFLEFLRRLNITIVD